MQFSHRPGIFLLAAVSGLIFFPRLHAADPGKTGSVRADPVFHEVADWGVEGQGWPVSDLKSRFDRLPAKAEGVVRDPVWNLRSEERR